METWKTIPSEPGYEVSDLGRVRSVDRTIETVSGKRRLTGRVLCLNVAKTGHVHVSLGRASERCVHDLVLEAFVETRPLRAEGRHLDGNPGNNVLANLSWGTRSQNNRDRTRHGQNKLTLDQVSEAKKLYTKGETGLSLARRFGVSKSTMYYALNGTYYGS